MFINDMAFLLFWVESVNKLGRRSVGSSVYSCQLIKSSFQKFGQTLADLAASKANEGIY